MSLFELPLFEPLLEHLFEILLGRMLSFMGWHFKIPCGLAPPSCGVVTAEHSPYPHHAPNIVIDYLID